MTENRSMEQTQTHARKTGWGGLIFFIAGLVAGAVLITSFGILDSVHRSLRQWSAAQMGKMLDTDFIYLRSGDILRGCIISQDAQFIWIEFPKGSAKIDQKDVLRIEKDPYTRYVRGLW